MGVLRMQRITDEPQRLRSVRSRRTLISVLTLLCLIGSAPGALASEMNLGPFSLGPYAAPPPEDYNLRLGTMRLGLTAKMGARYDDNVDRTSDDETGSASVGPGLGLRVYWPVSPYLQIRTSAAATYWYSSDDNADNGLEVTGPGNRGSDATVSAGIAPCEHVRLRLADSYIRGDSSLSLAHMGVTRDAIVSNNETSLQADVEWTKRITSLTRVAHTIHWAADTTYDYLDFSRESADQAVLWRLNKQLQAGPYGAWETTTYSADKHNDSREVSGGLAVVYDRGYSFNASARVGLANLSFDDSNVPGATSDYTGLTFGAACRFATTARFYHTLSVDYEAAQENIVAANYAKELTTRYGVQVKLRPRLIVSGDVAWVNARQSDGGERANLYQGGVGVSYELTERVTPTLSYQRAQKTSDVDRLDYVDNLVALSLSYRF